MENVSEHSSPHFSFIKRACCASGKSSKLPAKGMVRVQKVGSKLEAKWEGQRGFLINATQMHDPRGWCGLFSWETRLPHHDDFLNSFQIHNSYLKMKLRYTECFFSAQKWVKPFICVIFSNPLNNPTIWILLTPFFLDRDTDIWCGYMTWPLDHPINR